MTDNSRQTEEEKAKALWDKAAAAIRKYPTRSSSADQDSAIEYTITEMDIIVAKRDFMANDPSMSLAEAVLHVAIKRAKEMKDNYDFRDVQRLVIPVPKPGLTVAMLKNRPRNKNPGYILYPNKKDLLRGEWLNWTSAMPQGGDPPVYPGDLVDLPMEMITKTAGSGLPMSIIGGPKKTLIIFLHGMSDEGRAAKAWERPDHTPAPENLRKPIYPEVYWSHPCQDDGMAYYGNEFFLHVLENTPYLDGSLGDYLKRREKAPRMVKHFDLYTPAQLSRDDYKNDRDRLKRLRYCVYNTAVNQTNKAYGGGCDVLLPEYDGDVGFMIGAMEVCEILYDWAWVRNGATGGECGYKEILIVAHSMGGLVSRGILTPGDSGLKDLISVMNVKYSYYDRVYELVLRSKAFDSVLSRSEKQRINQFDMLDPDYENNLTFDEQIKFSLKLEALRQEHSLYKTNLHDLSELKQPRTLFGSQFSPSMENLVFSEKLLETWAKRFTTLRSLIQEKASLFVTLATPHEGTQVANQDGAPYFGWPVENDDGATFGMRTWLMKEINDKYLKPQDLLKLPQLNKFIVFGGRVEYGTPSWEGPLKLNELSYYLDFWSPDEDAYGGIKPGDLEFFDKAGVKEIGIMDDEWDFVPIDSNQMFPKDYAKPPIVDGKLDKALKHYMIDCDSAVRLDSALLYHYWNKLTQNPKFPNPAKRRENEQTFILNHADMKSVVVLDDIFKNPILGSWQDKMLKQIDRDNRNLRRQITTALLETL